MERFANSHGERLDYAKSMTQGAVDFGNTVAYWGGAGKSAMFLAQIGIDDARVVDSDWAKVGYCVPGTTRRIEHASSLCTRPVDIIIITTSWRANDIVNEINERDIQVEKILVFKNGKYEEVPNGKE